jgi:hypothetical protein
VAALDGARILQGPKYEALATSRALRLCMTTPSSLLPIHPTYHH